MRFFKMSEIYKFPDSFSSSQFVRYINKNEIQGLVESLGHTIGQRYEKEELIVIGVLKGSSTFMADLIREIKNVKVLVDFVHLGGTNHTKDSPGTIRILKDIKLDIRDKHVLIVEEIIDSGRALKFLKQHLELSCPKSLQIVTLFDKPYKRTVDLTPDLIGKKIEDCFVVGYGLDLEEYGRNFTDVYFLKYPN